MPPQERTPSAGLVCPLCKKLLKDAVIITCCGTSYCNDCITNHCFVLGSKKCPNCGSPAEKYDSAIIENAAVRQAVLDWLRAGNSTVAAAQGASSDVTQAKNSSPEPEKVCSGSLINKCCSIGRPSSSKAKTISICQFRINE